MDATLKTLALAARDLSEAKYAAWLKANSRNNTGGFIIVAADVRRLHSQQSRLHLIFNEIKDSMYRVFIKANFIALPIWQNDVQLMN